MSTSANRKVNLLASHIEKFLSHRQSSDRVAIERLHNDPEVKEWYAELHRNLKYRPPLSAGAGK